MNETIYVTGHRHPDTDSVCSAIAYAHLKRVTGANAIACRLGDLSDETQFLLNRFGFEKPYYLKDARATLADIDMDPPLAIQQDMSIYDALELMRQNNKNSYGVVDHHQRLVGLVTVGDLAKVGLGDTASGITLLKETPVSAICSTIKGRLVYDDPLVHINGKVSIIALTASRLTNYEITDRIVIVGDDSEAQKALIEKGAGMLIVVWAEDIDETVVECAKKHHCPIILSGHGSMNTSRYLYFAPPVKLVMKTKLVTFTSDQLAEEVSKQMIQSRYRAYPVLDQNENLVGYVSRFHILSAKNKQIIMVDHNEFSQSVEAIEKAELLEVIDHHRISDFSTAKPVAFRNEIVGSTCTIVSGIFQERQIPIPPNLAGLLLGAILSDTLKFRSPTTTQKDIFMANVLAQIAGLNIDQFARELFGVSTDISNKDLTKVMKTDMKKFEICEESVLVAQVILYDYADLETKLDQVESAMAKILNKSDASTYVVGFTSIEENGTKFYSFGTRADWVNHVFPSGQLQEGVLSRKVQIIPMLTSTFTKAKYG